MAASTASSQGIWLAWLLGDIRNTIVNGVELKVDNQSALALMKTPVFHYRSKHIRTIYHFTHRSMENGDIHPSYVCSEDHFADILTNSLPRPRFEELRVKIGMSLVGEQV
jgi:hypothetical protein